MNKEKISIIIPCKNEEKYIYYTLRNTINYIRKNFSDYEIICINDGSTDRTLIKINHFKVYNHNDKIKIINNTSNKGKGYSIKEGMKVAKYNYVLFMDADFSTPIEEVEFLLRSMKEYCYDMIVGSRHMKSSLINTKPSLIRRLYSKLFNFIVNYQFDLNIRDTQTGFKLLKKKACKIILLKSIVNGFTFDIECFLSLKYNNMRYKEVPITWNDNKPQKVSFKQILDMWEELTFILKHQRENGYK